MWKWMKRSIVGLVAVALVGFFVFGKDVYSYVSSSGRLIQETVKDSVPVEFEIQRARDLLEQLLPEMRANLKHVAREEVDVATLERELESERTAITAQEARIAALRERLTEQKASYRLGRHAYSRQELVDTLARAFDQYKTAELLVRSKEKLLETRRRSLTAAVAKLEKMRLQRLELAAQVEALEGQFRLVQAEASTSKFQLDNSKLAQTNRLISDLRRRLEVAQKVLAREARFTDEIPIDVADEETVLDTVDAHFRARDDDLDSSL